MVRKLTSMVLLAIGSRRGAALIEYALLAALIAVAITASMTTMGTTLRTKFTSMSSSI